jgi:hypothetical protein
MNVGHCYSAAVGVPFKLCAEPAFLFTQCPKNHFPLYGSMMIYHSTEMIKYDLAFCDFADVHQPS